MEKNSGGNWPNNARLPPYPRFPKRTFRALLIAAHISLPPFPKRNIRAPFAGGPYIPITRTQLYRPPRLPKRTFRAPCTGGGHISHHSYAIDPPFSGTDLSRPFTRGPYILITRTPSTPPVFRNEPPASIVPGAHIHPPPVRHRPRRFPKGTFIAPCTGGTYIPSLVRHRPPWKG